MTVPMMGNGSGKMKTLIVLALLMLAATASAYAGYRTVDIADVTYAVSHVRAAEPAQLLMCGAGVRRTPPSNYRSDKEDDDSPR